VAAGWLVFRLVLHIDREAVSELGAVVGEDGVNGMREVSKEALQEPGRGVGIPLGMDFQINVTRGAVDGDEGVAFVSLQRRQVLKINMDESDGGLLEDAYRRLGRLGAMAQAMALEAAMDSAARELGINTTSTQRRITSTMSSSGNCSFVRSSQISVSSIGEKLVCKALGVCEWSLTVVRPRHRRIVVSLTPSSAAKSATGRLLRWM
jgi:hypothetical protein